MQNETHIINAKENNTWNKFLDQIPKNKKDVYYHANDANLYNNKICKAKCFVYKSKENIFFYPFIKRNILNTNYYDSITPYGYGGPIIKFNDKNFLIEALNSYSSYLKENNIICEQIKFHPLLKNYKIFQEIKTHKIYSACKTVTVDCQLKPEFMWSNIYKKSNKEKIKKIQKKNAKVFFSKDIKAMLKFTEIYNENLKSINAEKKYFFDLNYFNSISNNLNQNFFIAHLEIEGEILASQIVIYGTNFGHTHLQGTSPKGKKLGVTNLLKHEVIMRAKKLNLQYLNFGGGRTNDKDDSLLQFKSGFSSTFSEFYLGEKIYRNDLYQELTNNLEKKKFFSYRNDNFIS